MTESDKRELISPEEILESAEEVPFSNVPLYIFHKYTNPESWEVLRNSYRTNLMGEVKPKWTDIPEDGRTLSLFSDTPKETLHLHVHSFKEDAERENHPDLEISALPLDMGVWASGQGDLSKRGVKIYFDNRGFVLSSRYSKWLLSVAYDAAAFASEHNDPFHQQPTFWR